MLNLWAFISRKYSLANLRSCPTCLILKPIFFMSINQLTMSLGCTVGVLLMVSQPSSCHPKSGMLSSSAFCAAAVTGKNACVIKITTPSYIPIRQLAVRSCNFDRSAPPYQSIGSFARSLMVQSYLESDRLNSSKSKYASIAAVYISSDLDKKSFLCCGSFCAWSASCIMSSGLMVTP